MTIRQVQERAEGLKARYSYAYRVLGASVLWREVLDAIANSDCQDAPAELAAEALKVMDAG